ncbi:MAG TPA: transposase [Chthoniobacterales bacterium]|jgi:REP element-mobilizing transposase RayT|nr:transposase [Chthoniobacterales bacterium]
MNQLQNGRDGALRRPRKIRPTRKQLPHDVPDWVDSDAAIYFITICCQTRGVSQLTQPDISQRLLDSIEHRHRKAEWFMHLALLMPDHAHFIISFPERVRNMKTVISKWKEWTAKSLKIRWQRDFFEHRLRRDESFDEKADYVRGNPVRGGLVANEENWPHIFSEDTN